MPSDPVPPRRSQAPAHPRGFPAADDAPAHVAAAVDVRAEVAEARAQRVGRTSTIPGDRGSMIPPSAIVEMSERVSSVPHDIGTQGVRFDLAFPAEERMVGGTPLREPIVPPPDRLVDDHGVTPRVRAPSTSAMRAVVAPIVDDAEAAPATLIETTRPDSKPPSTAPFERPRLSQIPTVAQDADARADASERDALVRDLAAIGPLDERPDRDADRTPGARATLARARALRFRLSLHDVWPSHARSHELLSEEVGRVRAVVPRPMHVDLAIECALLVAIADGGPHTHALLAAERDRAIMRALVKFLLAHRPELSRTALRDRGTATIARLTIVGWQGALSSLARTAASIPIDARHSALELAARIAVTPELDDHRVGALGDLERALGLPIGRRDLGARGRAQITGRRVARRRSR